MTATYVGPGGNAFRKVLCTNCGAPNGVPLDLEAATTNAGPVQVSPDLKCKCHRCKKFFTLALATEVPAGNRRADLALMRRSRRSR